MSAASNPPAASYSPDEPTADGGPLGILPRLSARQVRANRKLGRSGPALVGDLIATWNQLIGGELVADRFDVEWRAAGLRRPGVVAQLAWSRWQTRVALGLDPPLAHAVVDRLLGFERTAAEARLQVSPVEWGVLSFVIASGLARLEELPGPLGPWDLTIDRVGPDPFAPTGLGEILTWRWRVRVGAIVGTARLWLPESLLTTWLEAPTVASRTAMPSHSSDRTTTAGAADLVRFDSLISEFRAEVGTVSLAASSLVAAVAPERLLLIDDSPLSGTLASPVGTVLLVQTGWRTRTEIRARIEPGSAGDRLIVTSPLQTQPTFRTPLMVDPAHPASAELTGDASAVAPPAPSASVGDLTVTLTVELGRVNLPLPRLAELQPGAVIELNRHSREPVDLSSNGRLVARGELVQVDTELGVRITQVFF